MGNMLKKGRDEKYIKCGDIVIQFAKQYEKDKKYKSRHELSKDVANNIEKEYIRIQKLAKNQRNSQDRYFLNVMSTFEALVNSVHNACGTDIHRAIYDNWIRKSEELATPKKIRIKCNQ